MFIDLILAISKGKTKKAIELIEKMSISELQNKIKDSFDYPNNEYRDNGDCITFRESSKCPQLKAVTAELYNKVVELLEKVDFPELSISKHDNTNWTALHYAAYMGNDEIVKTLIERDESFNDRKIYVNLQGASCSKYPYLIDLVDNNNWNALYYATFSKNVKVIEALLEAKGAYSEGIDNSKSNNTISVLLHSKYNKLEYAPESELISREYKTGLNVLHIAAYNGKQEVVDFLLKKKPELNKLVVTESPLIKNNNEQNQEYDKEYYNSFEPSDFWPTVIKTPIHYAACNNRSKIIALLHENNPTLVKQADTEGCTALHLAARHGCNKATQILHKLAPDLINIKLNIQYSHIHEGTNVLQLAARNGHHKTVKLLLSYDSTLATQSDEIYTNALHDAAQNGHYKVVKILLEHDPELVDTPNLYGRYPIHFAAESGSLKTFNLILQYKKDEIYARAGEQADETVLSTAIKCNSYKIIEAILKMPSGEMDKVVSYSLYFALKKDTQVLIKQIAELAPNSYLSALHLATHLDNEKVASSIVAIKPEFLGENIDSQGNSLLHIAAINGEYKLAKFLLEKSPSLALLKNDDGNTAFHLSVLGCYDDISYLLVKMSPEIIKVKNNDNLSASQLLAKNSSSNQEMEKADNKVIIEINSTEEVNSNIDNVDDSLITSQIMGNSNNFTNELC